MNAWQIVGGIVSILGTVLMFYGSYQQAQGDKKFQDTVGSFVDKREAEDAPELVALAVEKKMPTTSSPCKTLVENRRPT